MTVALVALATTSVVLAVTLVVLVRSAVNERREWAQERIRMVDRAIARHSGEVIAMERAEKPRQPQAPVTERPIAIGL